MSYETILFSIDAGIARLTLNRPDKLNAFNVKMHGEVQHAVRAAHSAPDRTWVTESPRQTTRGRISANRSSAIINR
jgi:enoyl-CoA hydratase/carnithine racemase